MCGCILISWELQHAFRKDRSPVFRCSPIKTIRTKRLFRLRWHGHGPKSLKTVSILLQVNDSGSLRTGPRRQQLSRQTSQPPHGVRTYAPEERDSRRAMDGFRPTMGIGFPRQAIRRSGSIPRPVQWGAAAMRSAFSGKARRHWRPALTKSRDCKICRAAFVDETRQSKVMISDVIAQHSECAADIEDLKASIDTTRRGLDPKQLGQHVADNNTAFIGDVTQNLGVRLKQTKPRLGTPRHFRKSQKPHRKHQPTDPPTLKPRKTTRRTRQPLTMGLSNSRMRHAHQRSTLWNRSLLL